MWVMTAVDQFPDYQRSRSSLGRDALMGKNIATKTALTRRSHSFNRLDQRRLAV